ncbi:MAG: TasA family protein [Acidimicrobiia bacterium]
MSRLVASGSSVAGPRGLPRLPSGGSSIARLVSLLAALAVVGGLVIVSSQAAFNASTTNGPNSWSAGSVALADDDSASVMFNVSNMTPGDTATKCINVTYTGSLTADVKLYGSIAGTGLATYLNTTVDIGTGTTGGATASCTGFSLSSNLFNSTLASFGTSYTDFSTGLGGFAGATNPTTKSYRFTVTLQDNNSAQSKTATATFTWEAQNN